MATQVEPPLMENKTMVLFLNKLCAPYYKKLVGSITKSFVDMVIFREMIENSIKTKKFEAKDNSNSKKGKTIKRRR